jgi:acyl-CoA dehydrogenase
MRRSVYTSDHEAFRKTIRSFIEREVVPEFDEWYQAGNVPREMYLKLGELGVFGIEVPEEYGGAGIDSYKYNSVLNEETALAGVNFGGSHVHVELCLPYLKAYATDEQKRHRDVSS